MSDTQKYSYLLALSQLLKERGNDFTITNDRKLLYSADLSSIQQTLNQIQVTATKDIEGYTLDLSNVLGGYKVIYYKWIDQDFDLTNVDDPILIIHTDGKFAVVKDGLLEYSPADIQFKNEVSNLLNYYHLRNVLQGDDLSDHHNEVKEEYVFYSSSKGVIKIKYNTVAPHIQEADYTQSIKSLISVLVEPHYKSYFINSLFKSAQERPSVNLIDLIRTADQLIAIIKRDYELVLKQFDFENFKDKLLKEKDKYFSSIREILNKVFGQLVGIPISISASAFATYKVEDEITTLVLILIGFIFYVIIYVKIQTIYRKDINELENDFNRDFEIIKDKSGLPPDVIRSEREKIKNKISQTKSMINVLIGGIVVLGVSFVLYLGSQIIVSMFGHQCVLHCLAGYFMAG